MPYCEKCRTIVDDSCPVHKQKHLREPEPNDPVLIAELSGITAAMLEGVLLDESRNALGRQRIQYIRDELRAWDRQHEAPPPSRSRW